MEVDRPLFSTNFSTMWICVVCLVALSTAAGSSPILLQTCPCGFMNQWTPRYVNPYYNELRTFQPIGTPYYEYIPMRTINSFPVFPRQFTVRLLGDTQKKGTRQGRTCYVQRVTEENVGSENNDNAPDQNEKQVCENNPAEQQNNIEINEGKQADQDQQKIILQQESENNIEEEKNSQQKEQNGPTEVQNYAGNEEGKQSAVEEQHRISPQEDRENKDSDVRNSFSGQSGESSDAVEQNQVQSEGKLDENQNGSQQQGDPSLVTETQVEDAERASSWTIQPDPEILSNATVGDRYVIVEERRKTQDGPNTTATTTTTTTRNYKEPDRNAKMEAYSKSVIIKSTENYKPSHRTIERTNESKVENISSNLV